MFTMPVWSQADRPYIRKGNGKFEDGKYQQAEIEYRKALEKVPQSYRADYNLGNALYKQKQYDAAVSKYSSLAKNEKNRQNLNRFHYNLGNALYKSQKYGESVEAYKNALRNNPKDLDAKHNLQLAMQKLNEQKQQQDQKNRQNKDQQNKDQQQKNKPQPDQQDKDKQQAQPQQNQRGQISPEDADRILKALENEEKNVMKKVQDEKQHRQEKPLDKNW